MKANAKAYGQALNLNLKVEVEVKEITKVLVRLDVVHGVTSTTALLDSVKRAIDGASTPELDMIVTATRVVNKVQ
jgi:hypothetical protein